MLPWRHSTTLLRAGLALELFVRRIAACVGAYWTHLAGCGALVFGGGIGSHSSEIRARVVEELAGAWGIALDGGLNAQGEGRISTRDPARPVFAFETDEETPIARAVATQVGLDAD